MNGKILPEYFERATTETIAGRTRKEFPFLNDEDVWEPTYNQSYLFWSQGEHQFYQSREETHAVEQACSPMAFQSTEFEDFG